MIRFTPFTILIAFPLALYAWPALPDALQFDRAALRAGELWRLITCHFCHWSTKHLAWSGGGFVLLLLAAARQRSRRVVACLIASTLAIGVAVWRVTDLHAYRGLSGVDAALFALLAVTAVRESVVDRQPLRTIGLGLVLAAFVGKLIWELATGQSMFVPAAGVVVPVPLAHAVGALVGAACAMFPARVPARGAGVRAAYAG